MPAFVLYDVSGTFSLHVQRVGGDDNPIEFQWIKQIGQGGDFITFIVDGDLVLDNRFIVCKCGK